ncbi:MAG: choice-of-anchor D domain-containing protein [Pseudomonadota bacterium]
MSWRRLSFSLAAGALACSDYSLEPHPGIPTDAEPDIEVSPLAVDFGDLLAGEVAVREVAVRNLGLALLQVAPPELVGDGSFTLMEEASSFGLEGGAERLLRVAFSAEEPAAGTASLFVRSNDPDTPEIEVPLAGAGLVPWLEITPETYDFGEVTVPCERDMQLVLQNVGNTGLHVEALEYNGGGQLSLAEAPTPPFTLAPGACAFATVALLPSAEGEVLGTLQVDSDDPRGVRTATQAASLTWAGEVTDRFALPVDPPVDILFAVDRSGSMDDDAVALGAAFGDFIATLGALTSGWQIGVVTRDDGCANGGLLTAATPDSAAAFAAATLEGTDAEVALDEQLFQIVDRALQQTASGACNEGLLREGAPLHLVFVSDEPERSTETASAWTWSWFLARYLDWAPEAAQVQISGVLDLDACNEGAEGYLEAVTATGGQALSICDADWGAAAVALGEASAAGLYSFPLSAEPDPSTLEVTLDGAPLSSGWSWDLTTNVVTLELDIARAATPGAEVVVRYHLLAECM